MFVTDNNLPTLLVTTISWQLSIFTENTYHKSVCQDVSLQQHGGDYQLISTLIHFVWMCILCVYYSRENVFTEDVIHFATVLPLPVSWLFQDVQGAHVSNAGNLLNGVVLEMKSRFDNPNLAEAPSLDYRPPIKVWKRSAPVLLHCKGNYFKIPPYISESLNQSFRKQGWFMGHSLQPFVDSYFSAGRPSLEQIPCTSLGPGSMLTVHRALSLSKF